MGKKAAKKVTLRWKMHTPNLLKEILNNPSCGILRVPLNILSNILAELGECASRINDPELNELMCRLTIYEIADPESKEYDPKMLQRISRLSRRSKELRQKTKEGTHGKESSSKNQSDDRGRKAGDGRDT